MKIAAEHSHDGISDKCINIATDSIVKNILMESIIKPTSVAFINNGKLDYINDYSQNMGYFGIALQNCLFELFNGYNFYQSLFDTIARGGDTDTNGCICGALLGCYYGFNPYEIKNNMLKLTIPKKWIDQIQIDNPRAKYYPEVQQSNINQNISNFVKLINKN